MEKKKREGSAETLSVIRIVNPGLWLYFKYAIGIIAVNHEYLTCLEPHSLAIIGEEESLPSYIIT